MNISKTAAVAAIAGLTLTAAPAFAQNTGVGVTTSVNAGINVGGAHVNASANLAVRVKNAINRADREITRRITALTDVAAKVQTMTKISDSEKSSIAADVSAEIANLNTLKAKIDAETNMTALRTDIKSIANEYRIYILIIPVSRIQVAADKIDTVVSSYAAFSSKLAARIASAQAAGKDVTALNASLGDMNAKTTDANAQANAAVSLTANLKPDNGDQTILQSNQAAIKSARADIQAALADLKTARKDAGSIVKGLAGFRLDASASATTSTSTQ